MMGTVELSETEMLEMRYRSLDITREPFMYHWTWPGGGYDFTCTLRVVPPPPHILGVDSISIVMGTNPTKNMSVISSKRDAYFVNRNTSIQICYYNFELPQAILQSIRYT